MSLNLHSPLATLLAWLSPWAISSLHVEPQNSAACNHAQDESPCRSAMTMCRGVTNLLWFPSHLKKQQQWLPERQIQLLEQKQLKDCSSKLWEVSPVLDAHAKCLSVWLYPATKASDTWPSSLSQSFFPSSELFKIPAVVDVAKQDL